ncbi:MAG: oligogalacturonide lyase [Firmicutes bacterium]|nr:oligogalacturonide lyase [Bacillota bacterium]
MKAYEKFASEMKVFQDRVSGATVRQLTSYLGDSWHTYFTNNALWDNNKRLLFNSDRNNTHNLYSIELESGEISRLTDYKPGEGNDVYFVNDRNPKRDEIYFFKGTTLWAHNFVELESRPLYSCPQGFTISGGLCGADGKYVYCYINEDLSSRFYINMGASYVGFQETFDAKPDSRIVRVNVENGQAEEIWQEYYWLDHVNPSPVQANIMTFTHEGPWDQVDQRMWLMNMDTGKVEPLRPRKVEREMIGHEYWFENGVTVGYQVHTPDDKHYFGMINYDGTGEYEGQCIPIKGPADHIHSLDSKLIVSDAGNTIKLYHFNGKEYDDARVLCMHDGNFFHQKHHPHPKLMPNGKQVLYNSNCMGYCNMYLADIPEDVPSLPKVIDIMK